MLGVGSDRALQGGEGGEEGPPGYLPFQLGSCPGLCQAQEALHSYVLDRQMHKPLAP